MSEEYVRVGLNTQEKDGNPFSQQDPFNKTWDALKDFAGYINGSIAHQSPEQLAIWAAKQTYIALGFGLVAAASEEVDATPMEGFDPAAVDAELGLAAQGLHATLAMTLGFRDAANDYLANAKKVRFTADKLFIKK